MPGGTRRMPCNAVFRIRDRHPRTIIPDGAQRRTEAPGLRTETATAGSSVRLAPVGAVAGLDLQRHVQCGGALHALDEAGAHRLQRVQAHLQH